MEKNLAAVRGSYSEFYKYQSERSFFGEVHYTYDGLWDIMVFMFFGMAFFKNGIMPGRPPQKFIGVYLLAGLELGLILSYFRLQPLIDYNSTILTTQKMFHLNFMKYPAHSVHSAFLD